MKKPQQTTAELIKAARLAKSRRLHAALEPTAAARINSRQMYRQADLAKDAEVFPSQIGSWERGDVDPENSSLRKLAKALEVPWAELLGE